MIWESQPFSKLCLKNPVLWELEAISSSLELSQVRAFSLTFGSKVCLAVVCSSKSKSESESKSFKVNIESAQQTFLSVCIFRSEFKKLSGCLICRTNTGSHFWQLLVLVAVADCSFFSSVMVNLNGKYAFVSQENFDAYLKATGELEKLKLQVAVLF